MLVCVCLVNQASLSLLPWILLREEGFSAFAFCLLIPFTFIEGFPYPNLYIELICNFEPSLAIIIY